MDQTAFHEHTSSVPVNWLAGLYGLLSAVLLASIGVGYGSAPALVTGIAVLAYAVFVPLQFGRLLFSREAATIALHIVIGAVMVLIFVSVVGRATESSNTALSSIASLAFVAGLVLLGGVVLRATWRFAGRLVSGVPNLWSSAATGIVSRVGLVYYYIKIRG